MIYIDGYNVHFFTPDNNDYPSSGVCVTSLMMSSHITQYISVSNIRKHCKMGGVDYLGTKISVDWWVNW